MNTFSRESTAYMFKRCQDGDARTSASLSIRSEIESRCTVTSQLPLFVAAAVLAAAIAVVTRILFCYRLIVPIIQNNPQSVSIYRSKKKERSQQNFAGRRAVLLAKWIVRSVPLEIVGSCEHEKVPTHGKPGLERPGRPRGERIVRQALVDPTVTRSTIRADVDVAIVPQTISRHLVEANLKSKHPFRALPLTPEHRQLRLQWCQTRSM
ncbi:HTH_Tnp_Tc3_2 domain-containing protein [Trichonephila clavipes]|nr:HTH_Tnp_Tc3_2 domain-containing protein [Trichonephila clavipes]